jgi:hypothetical protein
LICFVYIGSVFFFDLIVSENDYIAMQVLGQGLEAGKRVLELTSPLALKYLSTRRLGHMTETSTGVMETFMNAGGLYAEPCSEALRNVLSWYTSHWSSTRTS